MLTYYFEQYYSDIQYKFATLEKLNNSFNDAQNTTSMTSLR